MGCINMGFPHVKPRRLDFSGYGLVRIALVFIASTVNFIRIIMTLKILLILPANNTTYGQCMKLNSVNIITTIAELCLTIP